MTFLAKHISMKNTTHLRLQIAILLFFCASQLIMGQDEKLSANKQPRVLVMPYTKMGESVLEVMKKDSIWNPILLTVNKGFMEKGAKIVYLEDAISQQIDLKKEVDILVKVALTIHKMGNKSSLTIALQSSNPKSNTTLFDDSATSPYFYFPNNDFGYVIGKILEERDLLQNFINYSYRALKHIK